MADVSRREAVYDINRYLTTRFTELDPTLFGEDSPFWPIQSDPMTAVPYIRYVTRETIDGDNWWMRLATVSYAVYAYDVDKSAHILNVMVDLLGRGDESAGELMIWRNSITTYPQDYHFHSIEFLGGYNTEPTDEEAGAHIRFGTFRYQYSPYGGTSIA